MGNIEDEGTLYYEIGKKYYKEMFKNNLINVKGIKYYKNGSKKIEGIFNDINSCEGIYYDPFENKIFEGFIINEIPNDIYLNISIYNDDTFILYEGEIINGKYDGQGIEYSPFIKDMVIYYGKFSKNYYIEPKIIKNKLNKNQNLNVLFISDNEEVEGKRSLLKKSFSNYGSCILLLYSLDYIYNGNYYNIWVFDSYNCFGRFNFRNVKNTDIVIYFFNISNNVRNLKYNILEMNEYKKKNQYIYLVGTHLDIGRKNVYKYRDKAKNLINEGKIKNYFEISNIIDEGIEFFLKNIKIDSAIIKDGSIIKLDQFEQFKKKLKLSPTKIGKFKFHKLNKYFNK